MQQPVHDRLVGAFDKTGSGCRVRARLFVPRNVFDLEKSKDVQFSLRLNQVFISILFYPDRTAQIIHPDVCDLLRLLNAIHGHVRQLLRDVV